MPLTFTPRQRQPGRRRRCRRAPWSARRRRRATTDDVVFETERDLVVTRAVLRQVFVSDTETDTYSDRTAEATGQLDEPFPAFGGDSASPHHLYVAVEPRADPRTSRSSCGRRTPGNGRTGRSSGSTGTAADGGESPHTSDLAGGARGWCGCRSCRHCRRTRSTGSRPGGSAPVSSCRCRRARPATCRSRSPSATATPSDLDAGLTAFGDSAATALLPARRRDRSAPAALAFECTSGCRRPARDRTCS